MVVFPAIGLLLWISFLLVVLVLSVTFWVLCKLILWLMGPKPRLTEGNTSVSSKRNIPRVPVPVRNKPPVPVRGESSIGSDIWPKWTASRRQYVDRELSLWQEQFDALDFRK